MDRIKAAFFNRQTFDTGRLADVFSQGRREQVARRTDLYPHVVTPETFDAHADQLADVEAVFSTWGMFAPAPAQLARLEKLRAVFYAAGSVQGFARPFLQAGVTVVSAWAANAVPVAEFTVSQILLSAKGYWANVRQYTSPAGRNEAFRGPGVYGETVALIGAGQVGRKVIELLKPYHLEVLVVDPYLPADQARQLGVGLVDLDEAFRRAFVVSNHLPNLPSLQRVLTGRHFAPMRPGATFINTGRGAQVAEDELVAVLRDRPDLTALLDVTHPEPPEADSPLYALPNVQLSTHIAGSLGDEVCRMADFMLEEFDAWAAGRPLRYAVTLEMLETMA